ncbi:MAG: LysR substrate-binding domain-containing protein [Parvibaculaceae bacterium]
MKKIHLKAMRVRRHLSDLPWTALRAFEAAARLASFKEAAAELSVTPTAVSHQIRRLEEHLGLRLFERLHRSLRLTPSGEALAEAARTAFDGLERTMDGLVVEGRRAPAGSLSISVVPSLASKWLAPRLHDFQTLNPNIGLRIVAEEALVDLRRDKTIDIALRYGPGPYEGLHAERLWPHNDVIAVCSPEVASDRSLRTPADLARHMLIRTAPPGGTTPRRKPGNAGWPIWFERAGVPMSGELRKALEGPLFSTTQLAIEAAAAGKGIALASSVLVDADMAAGRLAQLFSIRTRDQNAFWLLCRKERLEERRIRAFVQWIRRQAQG